MNATDEMIAAGIAAGRAALDAYSTFDSGMVPDTALSTFVQEVLKAALALIEPPTTGTKS
jgi:hypothetical protein